MLGLPPGVNRPCKVLPVSLFYNKYHRSLTFHSNSPTVSTVRVILFITLHISSTILLHISVRKIRTSIQTDQPTNGNRRKETETQKPNDQARLYPYHYHKAFFPPLFI